MTPIWVFILWPLILFLVFIAIATETLGILLVLVGASFGGGLVLRWVLQELDSDPVRDAEIAQWREATRERMVPDREDES